MSLEAQYIFTIIFLATGRTVETCNIEGDVARGDIDSRVDAENLSKSVIISSDSCSSISDDVISSSDVTRTKSPSSDYLVKIKVHFFSFEQKIQWGLEYRTLEYRTHWNTKRFEVLFSNGPKISDVG